MATFIGGIHPQYNKLSASKPAETAPLPSQVVLPLSQHIGAPSKAVVAKGDTVKVGQVIAEAGGFVSVPIHATISGTVKEIATRPHPSKGRSPAIVIESDGEDTWVELSGRSKEDVEKLTVEELRSIIQNAGIVGLGGAAFPTHVKLSPPKDKPIDVVLLNGAECEPFLTCDHCLMLDMVEKVLSGFELVKRSVDAYKAYVCIEKNKPDALKAFTELLEQSAFSGFELVPLDVKYPQGAEKMLIYAASGRKVPTGGLPMDVGCVVSNVGTCKAIHEAVYEGKPLVERAVTVTGAVKVPKNLVVRIGVSAAELLEQCGGANGPIRKLIGGGPMMGMAQTTTEIPIIKGSSGVLVQIETDIDDAPERPCIKCAKCVDVCPMDLMPSILGRLARKDRFQEAADAHVMDCFECGSCAYSCPSRIPLVHWIKHAKNMFNKTCKGG
ncbi:MAG: electron transport complex subunit RsxC [Methanopyri archaeon]|jgi:electron transport complex protein RnfC|nr:electron transport complex subunit RsxC [Methanopyri archaeon]